VGPTVLELLGVEALPEMDGVSLAAMIRGEKAEGPKTPLYSEGCRWGSERKALREGRWRVVYKPSPEEIAHSALPGRPSDRHWEKRLDKMRLHDLTEDPGQSVNLFKRRPEIAEPMLARLKEIMRRNEETASRNETAFVRRFVRWHVVGQAGYDDEADKELLRELRALGYVE
jgi:arylsulfatase A-like enzyme